MRPPVRTDGASRRDDTTRIVSMVAVCVAVLGIVALVMMRSGPAQSARPLTPPVVVAPEPEKTPAPAAITPPFDTVTRPSPLPRTTTLVEKNLVANPSCEQLANDKPVGWNQVTYNGMAQFTVTPTGRKGGNAACITSTTGGDCAWMIRIAVKPNATYLFKGWVRCENLVGARGAQFLMHPAEICSDSISGTSGWKQLQFSFESKDKSEMNLDCLYGGWGLSTGTAWFDDIEVTELFSSK